MKLIEDNYYNTGGNCMVMYVDVENDDIINQFGVNDEMVVALSYGEDYDEEIWWIDTYDKLVEYVGKEIAQELQERFLKYRSIADWFKK